MIDSTLLTERGAQAVSMYTDAASGPMLSPATLRRLRSSVTAVIALSLGVALASWLKAGAEPAPPPATGGLTTPSCCARGHVTSSSEPLAFKRPR